MLHHAGRRLLVGSQLSGALSAADQVISPRKTPILIGTLSRESIGTELRVLTGTFPASANYPTANTAMFIPFGIAEQILVRKLWVHNGSAVAGQVDVGIFDPAGNRIVSIGATNQAGTANLQEFDVTDTLIDPGRYYFAINSDTSGATQKIFSVALAVAGLAATMGVLQAALGHVALDSTVTYATCTQAFIPEFGLSTRALVA